MRMLITGVLPLQKKADSALPQVIFIILALNICIHGTTIGDTDKANNFKLNNPFPYKVLN